jgi:hypothetical protein
MPKLKNRLAHPRNLGKEIPPRTRDINAEIPNILIKNCRAENCGTGILLKDQRDVLVDGFTVRNTRNPIVDINGIRNIFRRIRRIR